MGFLRGWLVIPLFDCPFCNARAPTLAGLCALLIELTAQPHSLSLAEFLREAPMAFFLRRSGAVHLLNHEFMINQVLPD